VQKDRFASLESLGKVFAVEKLLNGEILSQLDQVEQFEIGEPLAVVHELGFAHIQNTRRLPGVCLRVAVHVANRHHRASLVFVRWIANERGVRADEEGHLVPQFLKLAQFAHGDGVAEMQVGGARVVAAIHPQRAAFGQFGSQFGLHRLRQVVVAVFGALHEQSQLLIEWEGH